MSNNPKKPNSTRTYIVFRLSRASVSQTKMAESIGCTFEALNQTINGRKSYPIVQANLAAALGYPSWENLVRASEKFASDIEHIYLRLSKEVV